MVEIGHLFPDVAFGVTNCRKISGSITWSQHAWSNALDIHGGEDVLDQIAQYLGGRPDIKVMLWQVRNHYDHIHVDTWPTGIGTPPCAGGALRTRSKNGEISDHFYLQEGETVLAEGSSGQGVRDYQGLLNRVVTPKITVDGDFGPATAAAVRAFQKAKGFPQTGNINSETAGLLATYTKRYLSGILRRGDRITIT